MHYINKASLKPEQLANLYDILSHLTQTAESLSNAPRCEGRGERLGDYLDGIVALFDDEMDQIVETANKMACEDNEHLRKLNLMNELRMGRYEHTKYVPVHMSHPQVFREHNA